MTGREPYPIEKAIAFQTFGIPDDGAAVERAKQPDQNFTPESHASERRTDGFGEHFAFADADGKEMTRV